MIYVIFLLKIVLNWEVLCDHRGSCLITTENNKDKNLEISQGIIPLYPDKKQIKKKWNKTHIPLTISSQINGISNYGILKGEKGYECTGGLWECQDSCCLDGFCVNILYFCKNKVDNIELIYTICGGSFVFFVCFYWMSFFIIGCQFNKNLISEEKEEQGYGKFNNFNLYNSQNNNTENETEDMFFKKDEKIIKKRNNTITFLKVNKENKEFNEHNNNDKITQIDETISNESI